jgi:hypothetical protein
VDALLQKFGGREAELFQKLEEKYNLNVAIKVGGWLGG